MQNLVFLTKCFSMFFKKLSKKNFWGFGSTPLLVQEGLREVVEDSGNRVMYCLSDGPERAFISEELMLVLEDTELPLKSGNICPSWIDISNGSHELSSFSQYN